MFKSAKAFVTFFLVIGGIFALLVSTSKCQPHKPSRVDYAVSEDALRRADEAEAQGRHSDAYEWRKRARDVVEGRP